MSEFKTEHIRAWAKDNDFEVSDRGRIPAHIVEACEQARGATVRTLDSGEKVKHFLADERHPEGRKVLIPGASPLRERLLAECADAEAAHTELAERDHHRRCQARERLDAGDSVPFEKRCL